MRKKSEKENKYWSAVTAEMMSEEEKVDDTYVRHPPSYRSERLNKFIQKLDERLECTPSHHARHARILGSPIEKPIPAVAKRWMLKDDLRNQPEGSDVDLFASDH